MDPFKSAVNEHKKATVNLSGELLEKCVAVPNRPYRILIKAVSESNGYDVSHSPSLVSPTISVKIRGPLQPEDPHVPDSR